MQTLREFSPSYQSLYPRLVAEVRDLDETAFQELLPELREIYISQRNLFVAATETVRGIPTHERDQSVLSLTDSLLTIINLNRKVIENHGRINGVQ